MPFGIKRHHGINFAFISSSTLDRGDHPLRYLKRIHYYLWVLATTGRAMKKAILVVLYIES